LLSERKSAEEELAKTLEEARKSAEELIEKALQRGKELAERIEKMKASSDPDERRRAERFLRGEIGPEELGEEER